VLISLWRIRHAWHKNLVNKCSDIEKRSALAKRLGDIISSICRGNGDVELFLKFLQDLIDCNGFVDYFKAQWIPRLGEFISCTCICIIFYFSISGFYFTCQESSVIIPPPPSHTHTHAPTHPPTPIHRIVFSYYSIMFLDCCLIGYC
jgi:hypothetical protein